MSTAIEIKAGVELDERVCEAVAEAHEIYTVEPVSTDLNSAFVAAEKVFGSKGFKVHWDGKRSWCEHWRELGNIESLIHGVGSTPALAICAAILKLKGIE
jgi:hypothetical protein